MKEQYIRINAVGDKYYYKDREMTIIHREDGPAIEYSNGDNSWYIDNKCHREDGPAADWAGGLQKRWYIHGKHLTEKEFNAITRWGAIQSSYDGKIIEVDGKKYKLTEI
jgi:hypothetical protein